MQDVNGLVILQSACNVDHRSLILHGAQCAFATIFVSRTLQMCYMNMDSDSSVGVKSFTK